MSEVRETCGCGAEWVGGWALVSEREKFRVAHAACRDVEIVKQAWCRADAKRNVEFVKVLAAATERRAEIEGEIERLEGEVQRWKEAAELRMQHEQRSDFLRWQAEQEGLDPGPVSAPVDLAVARANKAEAEVEHEENEKHKLIEAVGDIKAKRREAEAEVEKLRERLEMAEAERDEWEDQARQISETAFQAENHKGDKGAP